MVVSYGRMLKRKLKKRGKEESWLTFIYKWNIMAGKRRKLMGISAIRIDSTRVEWYYKGKDRKNAEETKGDGTNNPCRRLDF